jgi:hypothetical protein
MTLATIATLARRWSTKNSTSLPDSVLFNLINVEYEYVNGIIRTFLSNYDVTRYVEADVTTGTEVPKFRSLYHSIIPLRIAAKENLTDVKPSSNGFQAQADAVERDLKRWYGTRNYRIFTVTIAAPGVATLDNHGFNTNDRIIFETTGALPTGLSAETWYYVIKTGTHTFQIAATRDGAAITTSGSQSGTHYVGGEKAPRVKASTESCK